MAYPTGIAYRVQGPTLGLRPIGEASDVQYHPLGTVAVAQDHTYGVASFVYLAGVADTAPGDLVCYDTKTGVTVRAVANGATSTGPAAVAMSACIAGLYGWYAVEGSVPVYAATVADDARLYLTATAGQLDDTVVASNLVTGIVSRAATSGDYATCQLNHPSVDSVGGASGSNSGDVTLSAFGSTPAAAGAALTGQALALQPASATHPGGITAATFTALTGITKVTLTAEAENAGANTIEVEGQVTNAVGTAAAIVHEVIVRSIPVTSNEGDITIGAGANPGTLIKAFGPAAGVNEAWITTTAAGHFRFTITNTAAETNLVQVSTNTGASAILKLTFA